MKKYVCIDIGGTAIKYGIIEEDGRIVKSRKMRTEAEKGGPQILEKAVGIVEEYTAKYEISGICISTAGMVDVEKGEIFYSGPTIPNYKGTRLKETMENRFHVPCEVENDVNCAGLCEQVSGAAKGSKITLCLTVGTGIGGCILLDGKVFHGFSGSGCEIGYMHMEGGNFQQLGATSVLTGRVAEQKGASPDIWSGIRIFEAAQAGDDICMNAIDEMADILGKGIANICYVLNPQTVVLGGGVMAQEQLLGPKIQAAMERYLLPSISEHTTLAFARHGNEAGMLGAFYHFRDRHT